MGMATTADRIEQKLTALTPEHLVLDDESARHAGHAGAAGGGGHYRLTLVSPHFRGQALPARHRMVYAALGDMMQREIHALAIKAYTPEEFSQAAPL